MNKCMNCGNNIMPGDKYCRRCGTPVNTQNINNNVMPSQMANNNIHFTNNTGYDNQYNGNFNNNLNSNVNYNNNQNTQIPRKDNLSTLIVIIVVLVIGVIFILFMPTIKTDNNSTITIKDNTSTKNDNNTNSNNNNNSSSNPNVKKNTITFKETTLIKRDGYKYTFTTSGTENVLLIQNNNGDDEIIIQGIYKTSIKNINSKTSIIKNKYNSAGYLTGSAKYTTYKNKKLYTLEISQNSYKMLVGYYEIENGIVASFLLNDKNYTRYNYSGFAFLANIFDNATVSSAIKNGMSYEIRGNLSQIINNFLTK